MSDEKTIMPNELKAAGAVLDYAFVNFPALDGQVEKQLCATLIAEHTRHEGKTAQQWADECQRNLADAQADIAGEVAHSKELATRVTELEALASRLKEQRDTPAKPCWVCALELKSYKPSTCCGAECFRYKGYPDEPCWGQVTVIEEETAGDDQWWIHACQGHQDCYCNPHGKYRPEPTPNIPDITK
jgi:hypothetical protein